MYEFTFLVEDEKETKALTDLLTATKGKTIQEQKWGKRALAYSIKKRESAYFFTWDIELDPKHLSEFKKKLNFNEGILRYLILYKY